MKSLFNSVFKIVKPFGKTILSTTLSTITSIIVADKFSRWYRDYRNKKVLLKTNKQNQEESND